MLTILTVFLGGFMIFAAAAHLIWPKFYKYITPPFIPLRLANIGAFAIEAACGLLLLLPNYRKEGGLFFMGLMIAFLPIHIWDLFKERPAVGTKKAAVIRLLVQLLVIYAGWWIYQNH